MAYKNDYQLGQQDGFWKGLYVGAAIGAVVAVLTLKFVWGQ